MNGSQIMVETLIEQGVTDVFGYPGGQVLDIYDALYRARGRIRHILTAHEQGAAHAADGYARATGRVGVVLATSGPGATNLVTGIATAMLDSIPMVAITGNVPTSLIGKDSFQEINITGVTFAITKHNYFVSDVRELADVLREAFRIAKSGRPGPVLVDIPKDVQTAVCEFVRGGEVAEFPQERVSDADIERAAALIDAAERPYLYIGGGAAARRMGDALRAMAEKIDACIGCTLMGLSTLPTSYDRMLGMQGMHGQYASSAANRKADLILGVGIRFSDRATGNAADYGEQAKIIQLDADASEIGKNVRVDVGLAGDMTDAFSRLLARCEHRAHPAWRADFASLRAEGEKIRDEAERRAGGAMTPYRIFDVINRLKGEDTMLVTDVGQHQMWTAQFANFTRPGRFATSGGLGTMGYGLGAAVGAAVGSSARTVLITGDGSFGMNLNELATAVTYRLPLILVIMNNGGLGMVRQWQTLFYGGRHSESILHRKTDFVKLAEAFGAVGRRALTIEEFRAAFEEALAQDGPYVIDTAVREDELVLPMLPPGGNMEDIITAEKKGDGE